MEEILVHGMLRFPKIHQLVKKCGICLNMECTIQPNPIRFKLFLIAAQGMPEDQSTRSRSH